MIKIYSQKEFYKILDKERTRSDRTEREFSLLLFIVENTKENHSFISYLTYILSKRIRCYDDIGWVDKKHLCVILPETSAEGAAELAKNVCSSIIPNKLKPEYKIITYPSDLVNGKGKSSSLSCLTALSHNTEQKQEQENIKNLTLNDLGLLLPNRMPLWKRIIDVILAFCGLIILSPILIVIAMFIKTVSRGSIFFKQERLGFLGKPFNCWKFRTMKMDSSTSEHEDHFSVFLNNEISMNKLDEEDNRIIPFGKVLRKTGLDELPQLLNVIFGQMSLIGPRPCIPYESDQYLPWQHQRFDAVPGLTGLWQVSGKNRTTFNEMMRLDISYVKKKSIWLDFKILLMTVPAIIEQVWVKQRA